MDKLKNYPKWVKIQEIIFLCFVVLYVVGIVTGGLFTSYFATMALCAVGGITTITSLIGKQFSVAVINAVITIVSFVVYVLLPM